MRAIIIIVLIGCLTFSCKSNYEPSKSKAERTEALTANDTVRIADDKTEYEILIIEPGFNAWLASTARPEGYYSQTFLENRNRLYVTNWNQRVLLPNQFDPNLYELQIDYRSGVDYGYDVNYKLYNYFVYFQLKYKQRLAGWIPRI